MPELLARPIVEGNTMYTIQNTSVFRDIAPALHRYTEWGQSLRKK